MTILALTSAGSALGRQRAARVGEDIRVIDRALGDAQHSVLAETALHLAAEIVERAATRDVEAASIGERDRETLAEFGIDTSRPASTEDLMRSPTAIRGTGHHARIVAEAIPLADAAQRFGVDPSRLRQRIKEGTLIAVRRPRGKGWLVPRFQVTESGELPHLAEILGAARRHLPAATVARVFELPNDEIDGASPCDWLAAGGDPAPIARIIAGL